MPEHVEDLVAEGFSGDLQLVEKLDVDIPLAGVLGQQVPEMADLLLADPVDAPEALLQPVGVPWQVVVDHQMGPLQVHTLPGSVIGEEHHHLRIVHEGMHDLAAFVARHPTMDLHHRLRPAEPIADLDG